MELIDLTQGYHKPSIYKKTKYLKGATSKAKPSKTRCACSRPFHGNKTIGEGWRQPSSLWSLSTQAFVSVSLGVSQSCFLISVYGAENPFQDRPPQSLPFSTHLSLLPLLRPRANPRYSDWSSSCACDQPRLGQVPTQSAVTKETGS